ncbi:MAG TPA: hypothetical protein VNW92_14675 [Polyangiaceae bacterium]|jgi:hypothetical protein|nr:hypothetical protein [Polyangiaceae bacterium]
MWISKRWPTTFGWALTLLYAAGCSGSLSAGGGAGGTGGSGASGAGGLGGAGAGGAAAGSAGACAACPFFSCGSYSTPLTKPGECCPSSCSSVSGDLCKIDLQTFENNGFRSCGPNDNAEVAGDCSARYGDYGTSEVCGNFRLYADGHDGRIGCAYDSTTGDLVGGFLWGIPVGGLSCVTYFAGPAELASCAVPSTPFCRQGAGGAQGVAGEGGAGEGGAGEGGAAGSP